MLLRNLLGLTLVVLLWLPSVAAEERPGPSLDPCDHEAQLCDIASETWVAAMHVLGADPSGGIDGLLESLAPVPLPPRPL